ncbi:hypothetical protein DFH06DRAFT_574922 [Mycena polygramma]|nr:hypothetical protein DFH06DRAFT_574922 [Mycena polygramma]
MTLSPSLKALSQQETLDIKRTSGKAPCAECKRLKLRCDKKIPCASCVRRGCTETCPTGTYLPTGRGRRAVPTEASQLKRVLSQMEARMNELETAITRASKYHLDVCPLLGLSSSEKDPNVDQLADSLGALSVNSTGNSQYFGPTAGTEALLSIDIADYEPEEIPFTFTAMTDMFSFGFQGSVAWDPDKALHPLLAYLPAKSRAWELVEVYYENGCWSGTPIMREELVELLNIIYGNFNSTNGSASTCSVHQLAVLYGVFALGALVDLVLPPYSAEAEHYFDLCRASLSALSVFDSPITATIQALVLVSLYYSHGGPRFSMDAAWSVASLASSFCKIMGLHSGHLEPGQSLKQIQRRRALFWETYSIETLLSPAVGRPTGTYLASIDCPFPTDEDAQTDEAGGTRHGYYHRRWQFVKQVAGPVMENYLTAQSPSYDTIVELDQRIRRFMQSPMCTDLGPEDDDRSTPTAYMHRRTIHQSCASMLVYIHNHAFVRAVRENPDDPYYTSLATSFLSAYRYASEIIRADIDNFKHHPALFSRWWPVWKSLFSAAIVVGAVAAKCPQSAYGPRALLELFVAVDLFEGGAASCFRARGALTVLRKLRAKAMAAYARHSGPDDLTPNPTDPNADADADATLDVFAGRTLIVAQSILARDRCRHHAPQIYPPIPVYTPTECHLGVHFEESVRSSQLDSELVEYFSSPGARPNFVADVAGQYEHHLATGDTHAHVGTLFDTESNFPAAPFFDGTSLPTSVGGPAQTGDTDGYMQGFLTDEVSQPQWMEFLQNL